MSSEERALALFDFDGTLVDRDSMLAYCQHVVGPARYWLGMVWLTPMLALYITKLIPNDRAKVIMLRHFLGGHSRDHLAERARSFSEIMDSWLRPGALERVRWHLDEGHDLFVVSASLDIWLGPWADRHGLKLLCTRAAYDEAGFAGLDSANCHGAEKVRRVQGEVDPGSYATVYAYGDSSGDTQMLAIASEASFRPFRG